MKTSPVFTNPPAGGVLPWVMGGVVMVVGALVLAGWVLGIQVLPNPIPGAGTMKANAALAFILGGGALLLLQMPGPWARNAARVCTLVFGGIALLTLVEYASHRNFGIDELLIRDTSPMADTSHPGRIALPAAIGLVLTAAALWFMSRTAWKARQLLIIAFLGSLVVAIGAVAMVSYLAEFRAGYSWWNLTAIPLHTALLLVLLGTAQLHYAWRKAELHWLIGPSRTIGFVCVLALLVAVAAYSNRSTTELVNAAARVKHTHQVIGKLNELRSYLDESQSSVRGYVITGDETFLPLFDRAIPEVRENLVELHELTLDNANQQAQLAVLEKLIPERLEFSRKVIDMRRNAGFDAAVQLDAARRGKALMDTIRVHLGAMDTEEDRLLIKREAQADAIIGRTFSILPAGVLLSVLILTVGLLRLNGEMAVRQHVEDDLRQEQLFSKSVLESLPGIFYVYTYPDLRLVLWNKRHESLFGYETGGIKDRRATDWFLPESREAVVNAIEEVMTKGQSSIEAAMVSKDGHLVPMFLTGVKFKAQGQSYLVGTGLDITERKRTADFLRLVVNNIPDFVFWKDRNSVFLGCNIAFAKVAGVDTPDDIIGKTDYDMGWKKEESDSYVAMDRRVMESDMASYHIIEPQLQADGKQAWLETCKVPLHDEQGQVIGLLGTYLDITERKQAEDQIRELNASLERRVSERTAQLETAVRELDSFSYSVSHDLRSPLRAVDGFSRILIDDHASRLDDDGLRMLGVIRNETQRMGQLIDDLLAFSRLGRQQLESEMIDMHALAQTVFDELAALDPARQLRLDLHPLPSARGTKAMIRQVWANLISNAIKFTRDRAPGEIEIGVRDGADGVPIYYVKDNGAGFDMRYADKLFGVFQRLHTQQEFTGTGVGLALVERIVQRHGGRVWAEGGIQRGAVFYFTLTANKP